MRKVRTYEILRCVQNDKRICLGGFYIHVFKDQNHNCFLAFLPCDIVGTYAFNDWFVIPAEAGIQ